MENHDLHALELVTILEAHDTFALGQAKTILEGIGIDYVVTQEEPELLPGFHGASGIGTVPLWKSFSRIQVKPESAAMARSLLEHLQHPEPEND